MTLIGTILSIMTNHNYAYHNDTQLNGTQHNDYIMTVGLMAQSTMTA